jgi:hypothetical protein
MFDVKRLQGQEINEEGNRGGSSDTSVDRGAPAFRALLACLGAIFPRWAGVAQLRKVTSVLCSPSLEHIVILVPVLRILGTAIF